MAIVDYTAGSAGVPFGGLNNFYTVENTIDFSKKPALASTVVEALNIESGTLVLNVACEVITAEGAASTATVGDAGTANGFDADFDLNAATGTITVGIGGTDAYITAGGHLYTANDTIDLTLSANAVDTAVIKVTALCVKL